jgi:glycerophosphoryl diester phosphodiesterase
MHRLPTIVVAPILVALAFGTTVPAATAQSVGVDPRVGYLVDLLPAGALQDKLASCMGNPLVQTDFSIGHRGAPLMFPEHTAEGYTAAARMGAGILECDVTFTKDRELVCRHAQDDLHTSTNIFATPLASTCAMPFTPAAGETPAAASCRTADITLAEFRTLKGKMDGADATATTVEAYMAGTAPWRTDLYASHGTLMTHAESIALFRDLGAKFTPELKAPVVEMPFDGMTQEMYAQKMIDDYKAAGIPPTDVFPQSFNLDDVLYWIKAEPEFGAQAVYLEDSYDTIEGWSPMDPATWDHAMADLKAIGVNYIAPPLWVLVTLQDGKIVPSVYAAEAKAAGLNIITWTLERSGPLAAGGGSYYQSITAATTHDGVALELLDVLAQDVGVVGVFSDWPGTVTFYANCMGL